MVETLPNVGCPAGNVDALEVEVLELKGSGVPSVLGPLAGDSGVVTRERP